MLDVTFRRKLASLFDECLSDHLALETDVLSSRATGVTRMNQMERAKDLLQIQFDGIDRLIGDDNALYRDASTQFRAHALFRDVFRQAAVATAEKAGFGGGPFSFRFRRLVFERPDLGYSPYAQMLNEALLDLPLCRAMRDLSDSLSAMLLRLKPSSRVLGIGCGSATEYLSLSPESRFALTTDLADTLPEALTHVRRYAGAHPPTLHLQEHEGQVVGEGSYDLIYAQDTLAKLRPVASATDAAARITVELFRKLAPGGRLLLASPLTLGGGNPYRLSHRMILDSDDVTMSVYRSPVDLINLTSALPDGSFRASLVMEDLVSPIGDQSIFGVLNLEALAH